MIRRRFDRLETVRPSVWQRQWALDKLPYIWPSQAEWLGAIDRGFTTNGPSVPWPLKKAVQTIGFVDHGGPDELSWPPFPYPLHDYWFYLQEHTMPWGPHTGRFRMANAQLRDYQELLIQICHKDTFTVSDAQAFIRPVYGVVKSKLLGWRSWLA